MVRFDRRPQAAALGWKVFSGLDSFLGGYMKTIRNFLVSLVRDENGGEVLEYALVASLIVIAAIATITSVGGRVLARWNSLNSSV
jgi:pilus assembly protein Flp/PilA